MLGVLLTASGACLLAYAVPAGTLTNSEFARVGL